MVAPVNPGTAVMTVPEAQRLITAGTATGALADPVIVQRYIDAATQVVEGLAGPIVIAQKKWSWDGGRWALPLPWRVLTEYDVIVVENGVTLNAATDYEIDVANGMLNGGVWPGRRIFASGSSNIKITAWVGRITPPAALRSAIAEELSYLWRIGQSGPRPSWNNDGGVSSNDYPPSGAAISHRVYELAQFADHNLPGFA